MLVIHPFKPIYDSLSRTLILGSLPSVISRENNFYYGNKNNRFWKVISSLLGKDMLSMDNEEKTRTLLEHHIALYDVIYSCEIVNSSDSSIKNVKYTNIKKIVKESGIKRIFLNGRKAYDLFIKKYPEYKNISVLMPSTSPANAACSMDDLYKSWEEILKYL